MERLAWPNNPFGGAIWYRPTTASTMDDAESLLAGGRDEGSLVLTDWQSAGQGRFSTRRWETGPGEALLFTLIIPPGLSAPGRSGFPVSMLMALGLARWLAGLGLAPAIKWPNDVLVSDRKLAGILVTGARGRYLAGIGINLGQTAFDQDRLRRPATSLRLEGLVLEPRQALCGLLDQLFAAFAEADPRLACEGLLWQQGKDFRLQVTPEAAPVEGTIAGLDADGALLLDTASGRQRFLSGE